MGRYCARSSGSRTLGLIGGDSLRIKSKLMPLNHLCFFSSLAPEILPSRLSGSFCSSFLRRLRQSVEICMSFGQMMSSCRIRENVSVCPSPLNGVRPQSISKISMPSVHQSTAPLWLLPSITSGAMYSSVPTNEKLRGSTGSLPTISKSKSLDLPELLRLLECMGHIIRERPLFDFVITLGDCDSPSLERSKSVRATCPLVRISTFSGFKSRYTKPRQCRYSSARMTSAA
mmetsp:Transcript_12192/g.37177  ORF Transcript_12192/g.37177 Transcript_12192/m.37177 type:complete len:230 (+) Transcript_12192:580-1269(+)